MKTREQFSGAMTVWSFDNRKLPETLPAAEKATLVSRILGMANDIAAKHKLSISSISFSDGHHHCNANGTVNEADLIEFRDTMNRALKELDLAAV